MIKNKEIRFSTKARRADIGPYKIYRILPNEKSVAVGPFVFLDYAPSISYDVNEPKKKNGHGSHPHKGIATLTYVLNGLGEHYDSAGHHGKISSGGIQWMKAGSGVVHDETLNPDPVSHKTQAFQFWINLPAKNKSEAPEYIAIQPNEVPLINLVHDKGWIKVIVGEYQGLHSKVPNYSQQFLYHLHLEIGEAFSLQNDNNFQIAAFIAAGDARINDHKFESSQCIYFKHEPGNIEIQNTGIVALDIILFGGEPYTEKIVAEGPFVMNTNEEIFQAYRDFHSGKFGQITFNR